MTTRIATPSVLLVAALIAAACASSKPSATPNPSQAGKGFRTLEAVVVGRDFAPSGAQGTPLSGGGSYSLDFEAKDGEANVHYHFPVTRDQYNRYHEGDRVLLVMGDNELRDIRQAK